MRKRCVVSNCATISGMGLDDIAQATGHSKSLVREYLDLIEEFQLPPIANPNGADRGQSNPASEPSSP